MGKSSASKVYRLYYVEWYDHWSPTSGGWVRPEDHELGPVTVKTVGWKTGEDKNGFFIAGSIAENGQHSGVTYILKGVVVKKKQLAPSIKVVE